MAALWAARWQIADLGPQGFLGLTTGNVIRLDDDGGGRGWFLDPTPFADEEFGHAVAATLVGIGPFGAVGGVGGVGGVAPSMVTVALLGVLSVAPPLGLES